MSQLKLKEIVVCFDENNIIRNAFNQKLFTIEELQEIVNRIKTTIDYYEEKNLINNESIKIKNQSIINEIFNTK